MEVQCVPHIELLQRAITIACISKAAVIFGEVFDGLVLDEIGFLIERVYVDSLPVRSQIVLRSDDEDDWYGLNNQHDDVRPNQN